ncbi:hypothetical protein [Geosporobacter ferrireducens]|uniref:hypothetical protein n=1 Tax=Geosporobacter ferrireducens TaxID=1424294 RepID=UPI00139AC62B|nr:hypothetical protein [Geosporobacter ferrireducens]MTI53805.1 hypothetical protein [Geosporobacter ferrireducens]
MGLRNRYMPADIREDVKLGKLVPITSLPWILGVLVISIIAALIIRNPFIGVLLVILSFFMTTGFFVLEVPKYRRTKNSYKKAKKKINDLMQLSSITAYGSVCKLKNKAEAVIMEYAADPWEVCETDKQDKRADIFSQDVFSILKAGGEVSIYRICTAEDTASLERRYARLKDLPEGSRELENARIEHHYKESRKAKKTRHIIRIVKRESTAKGDEEELTLQDILGPFEGENSVYLGAEAIKELETWQLTPNAKVERGEQEQSQRKNRLQKIKGWIEDRKKSMKGWGEKK